MFAERVTEEEGIEVLVGRRDHNLLGLQQNEQGLGIQTSFVERMWEGVVEKDHGVSLLC